MNKWWRAELTYVVIKVWLNANYDSTFIIYSSFIPRYA